MIVAILMGLVAPLTVNQIAKSQDHVELLNFKQLLKELSRSAYFNGSSIVVELEGKGVTITDTLGTKEIQFDSLSFKAQYLTINANGFSTPQYAQVEYKQQTIAIDMMSHD